MCEPTTIMLGLAAAGAATTAASAISAGKVAQREGENAQAMGNYQKAQAEADADTVRGEAQLQAAQIREAGKRQRSAAVAASAGSGFSVDDGTAELINFEIIKGAEKDALTTILSGNTRARQIAVGGQLSQMSGNNAKTSGDNALKAGYNTAMTSALKFGSQAAGGWSSTAANPMDRYTKGNFGSGD